MPRIFAAILALSSAITFSSCATNTAVVKTSVDHSTKAENVRELIDPNLLPALEHFPPQLSLITRGSVVEARALVSQMLKTKDTEGVSVTKKQISSAEGEITVFIYQPKNIPRNKPGILWIHGGGFIMGNADSNDFAGEFSKELNATVVSVDYRLAPEHPFPAGLNDSYTALLWMVENAKELGVDSNRIVVGGDSAGAGMAAGLVLRSRDEKKPKIALQFLLYPMLDNLHDTPSGSIEDYPVWNRQTSFNAWEMYLNGKPGANASPYASAARAKDVSGLPPTFITTGAVDLFRDEIIDYAQRLMASGVPTQLAVFPGMYHGGQVFVPDATVSQRMKRTYINALEDAFSEK
jgi:acetyl esterase/lipase